MFLLSTRQCAGYSWIPLILGIQAQADSIWILTLNLYRDVQKVWIPSCLVLPSLPFLCIYLFLFILAFCLGEERLSASLASISAIHLFWHQAHCFTAFPGLFQSPFHSYILILGKKKNLHFLSLLCSSRGSHWLLFTSTLSSVLAQSGTQKEKCLICLTQAIVGE